MPKETFTALCHWTRSKDLLAVTAVSVEEQILCGRRLAELDKEMEKLREEIASAMLADYLQRQL